MSESADRRAERKLLAGLYSRLPSRETLQAATQLEQTRMQRRAQSEQLTLQKASLAVAVLSQIPRDNEDNKPAFSLARSLLEECLQRAVAMLHDSDDEDSEPKDDVGEDEEPT